ncbi:MAG: hypothetical protein K2M91_06785 [Lachnospiraceae bacterium]|nr:hypothetical protein [Lachnospiraceae bacterium]
MITNIGKGVLYQLIGIQDNDKKTVLEVNGISKDSPCANCPWMKAAQANPDAGAGCELLNAHCAGCKDRCFELGDINLHTEYIYESRYGTRPRLNKNAVLLFMLLHLQSPDASGFISGVAVADLAEALNIHERSVRNNLEKLKESGYIYYDMSLNNTVNVILLDYKTYYATAREGGFGYIKVSDSVINELSNVTSIIFFRIIVRQYLESDRTDETTKTYKELLQALPRYCRRSIIDEKIKENQGIFSIFTNFNSLTFKLSPEYNVKAQYEKQYKDNTEHYRELLDKLNDFVFSTNKITSDTIIPNELTRFFSYDGIVISTPYIFQMSGFKDMPETLAKIACKYGLSVVDNALADTYRLQMCTNHKLIRNLGAFILTVIKNNLIDRKSDNNLKSETSSNAFESLAI